MSDSERIKVGTFGRAHGVRGEVRFFPLNPESNLLEEGLRVFVRRGDDDVALTDCRVEQSVDGGMVM